MKPDCTRTIGPSDAAELPSILASLGEKAVLCLEPGRYAANLRIRRSVTLRGAGDGVILDGGHRTPTVEALEGEVELVLEQLTLTGGSGGLHGRGGNLHVQQARSVTLRRVSLEDGRSLRNGGGAILAREGTILVEDSRMIGNRGRRGQAVLIDGPAVVTLRRCLIVTDGGEVARVVGNGELHLEHSTLLGDVAVRASGDAMDAPVVTIEGCILGATPLALDAPGPSPSVRVTGSSLSAPAGATAASVLAGVEDGGGNRAGELGLDDAHHPRAGSVGEGRGAP